MVSRTLRHVAVAGVASALVAGGYVAAARAQTTPSPASAIPVTSAGVPVVGPMLGPPRVTWLGAAGDANGASGDTRVPAFVLDPIRMSLLGTAVPHTAFDSSCGPGVESSGIATAGSSGFALQHAAGMTLIPRLTLSGFSRGGCAADSAIGGALVYATPIAKNVFFVASAGFVHLPHAQAGKSVTRSDVRADVVFAQPRGRSLAVGIGTRGGTFGGTF